MTTLTAPAHAGLDEIDARRLLTLRLAEHLDQLDTAHARQRDTCRNSGREAISDQVQSARQYALGIECTLSRILRHALADELPDALGQRLASIGTDLAALRQHLSIALGELVHGCGHVCPEVPHDRATAEHITTDLLDTLTGDGYQIARTVGR
jgi:hypothetical protein